MEQEQHKQEQPVQSEQVTALQYQGKEILLVGTAHVSKESAALVEALIRQERPDSVCIELDQERYQNMQNPKAWEETDIVQVIKSKKVGFLLANLALSSYQKKIAKQLDTNVGQEMNTGIRCAQETGAQLVLADRSLQTTFLRIWRKLNLWEKAKLLYQLVFSLDDGEELTDQQLAELLKKDMLESMMTDMKKEFPAISQVLIHERDQHLAYKIKNAPGKKIVAVLGAAHVPGVKEEIYRQQDMEEITTVPAGSKWFKAIGWLIPILILLLIAYGFYIGADIGLDQIKSWILWNGSLAAICTAVCFGHPLSILTAFVSAPITSLNPLLACGWFAGLMEAHIRKPTVQDVNRISEDIFSLKGFLRNRFLRTLLIVVMANLGSSAGTIIAGLDIIKNLF